MLYDSDGGKNVWREKYIQQEAENALLLESNRALREEKRKLMNETLVRGVRIGDLSAENERLLEERDSLSKQLAQERQEKEAAYAKVDKLLDKIEATYDNVYRVGPNEFVRRELYQNMMDQKDSYRRDLQDERVVSANARQERDQLKEQLNAARFFAAGWRRAAKRRRYALQEQRAAEQGRDAAEQRALRYGCEAIKAERERDELRQTLQGIAAAVRTLLKTGETT